MFSLEDGDDDLWRRRLAVPPLRGDTCQKCKKIILGDTDGYIRGPHG